MFQEPLQARAEARQLLQQRRLDRGHGEQWDQPDHRVDLQRLVVAGAKVQYIVEELVLLIPERNTIIADIVHRLGNIQEMLEELGGYIFVDAIMNRQLQRD